MGIYACQPSPSSINLLMPSHLTHFFSGLRKKWLLIITKVHFILQKQQHSHNGQTRENTHAILVIGLWQFTASFCPSTGWNLGDPSSKTRNLRHSSKLSSFPDYTSETTAHHGFESVRLHSTDMDSSSTVSGHAYHCGRGLALINQESEAKHQRAGDASPSSL